MPHLWNILWPHPDQRWAWHKWLSRILKRPQLEEQWFLHKYPCNSTPGWCWWWWLWWWYVKFLRVFNKLPKECSLNINWRVNKCGTFPDCLESFRTVWKVSNRSGKFQNRLESFRTVWEVSGQFGKLWTVWKDSRQSWKFPDSLETLLVYFIVFLTFATFIELL